SVGSHGRHHISSGRFACRLRPAGSEPQRKRRLPLRPVHRVDDLATLRAATALAAPSKKGPRWLAGPPIRPLATTLRSAYHRRCLAPHTCRARDYSPCNGLELG